MRGSPLPALWTAFRMGAGGVMAEPLVLVGQIAIFTVLILSFSAVFRALPPAALDRFGLTAETMLCYFTVTETVFFASSNLFRDLQQDIRSGAIEPQLLRPLPFWRLRVAESLGVYAMRAALLGPCFAGFAWVLGGRWGLAAEMLPLLVAALLLSGLIVSAVQVAIGCAVLWAGQSEPFYWIWQKSAFVLGALLWPLALYPEWVRGLAWATPFPAVYATPGELALEAGWDTHLAHLGHQMAWAVVALLAAAGAAAAVRRRFAREGG